MEHISLFPVDTVKTHMQASGSSLGFVRTMRILKREEGLMRFWKGANVVSTGCIPAHACQFCCYEVLKKRMEMRNEEFNIVGNAFIGASTVIVHDFFITPADILKQRMQLCKNLTARVSIANIVKEEGIKGLYRSYPLTVLMNIPFQASVVCVNENMKTLIKPWEKKNPHFWYFICAGTAGAFAGFITNPIDVVKTRLQT